MFPDLEKLRTLAAADPDAAHLLDIAGHHRVRDGVSLLSNLLKKSTRHHSPTRAHEPAVAALRRIELCGFGRLLQPTVRHRTRFEWRIHPHVIAQALREKDFVLLSGHLLGPGGIEAGVGAPATGADGSAPEAGARTLPSGERPPGAEGYTILGAGWQRHLFNLRPGMEIALTLPADLTLQEAERLAHLLRASVPHPES